MIIYERMQGGRVCPDNRRHTLSFWCRYRFVCLGELVLFHLQNRGVIFCE